jgi:UDP-3-O-[3-hydroxymyristoyl] glucosamine N-acyltransferase
MIGYSNGRPGRIVGDEADLGTATTQFRNAFGGTRYRDWTQIDNSIKIEQHRVVGIDDGRGCAHR